MSASKKKLQRRQAEDTKKVTQAQAEQAAYKKKVRLYTIIGVVVVVLVAALLVWNSGMFQKNATAATIGDEKLSVAELSYYYYNDQIRYTYSQYGLLDSTKSDANQIYDEENGLSFQDLFMENALNTAQQVQVMYNAALAAGYSAADVEADVAAEIAVMEASAAAQGASYKTLLKSYFGRYMTPAAMKEILTRNMVASLYANDLYSETFDGLTADELEGYYAEHKDDVDTITFSSLYFAAESVKDTDEDGNKLSEDEVAALKKTAIEDAKNKAVAALKSYDNGTAIADLIEETSPTTSVDHTSVVGTSSISSVYRDELLMLAADEAVVVENENYGFYVVIFHERGRNETPAADVRHILFHAATTTDENGKVVAPTEQAWAEAEQKAQSALAEYQSGQQTAEAFGALAEKYSADGGSNTNGGLYTNIVEGNFVAEFNDWMFGEDMPNPGDTAVIRHEGNAETEQNPYWGYHVTYLDRWGEATWQLNVRSTMANDAITEMESDLCEAAPAALTSAAFNNIGK